jgi:hypothetical protein
MIVIDLLGFMGAPEHCGNWLAGDGITAVYG